MSDDVTLEEMLERITPLFQQLGEQMVEMANRIVALEDYMNKIREVISVPPMFPSDPYDGQSFYDEVQEVTYHWYADEYFPEDSKWIKYYD